MNKKYLNLVIVVISIFVAIGYLENQKAGIVSPNNENEKFVDSTKSAVKEIDSVEYLLSPELAGISGYLNTDGKEIKISDYSGKVVLIDFWTYTCINCIRTLPYLTAWDSKYLDKGLVIIGVHTPEFEFEKERENVQSAIDKYSIEYPVVQDNDRGTWSAFNNRFWPAKYLIDSEGYIRYFHFGEGNYEETELQIQKLLEEAGKDTSGVSLTEETDSPRYATTPELYAGAVFALPREQYIGNDKNPARQEEYILPENMVKGNVIYLDGLWTQNADNLHLQGDEGIIALDFTASEVNIVADNLAEAIEMDILIDRRYASSENAGDDVVFDEERAYIIVDSARLYNIYKGEYGNYRLDLKVKKDFTFNAFTFG